MVYLIGSLDSLTIPLLLLFLAVKQNTLLSLTLFLLFLFGLETSIFLSIASYVVDAIPAAAVARLED